MICFLELIWPAVVGCRNVGTFGFASWANMGLVLITVFSLGVRSVRLMVLREVYGSAIFGQLPYLFLEYETNEDLESYNTERTQVMMTMMIRLVLKKV